MKWLVLIIFAIFLTIFQASFLPFFEIFAVAPNLILVASLFILIFRNFREAIFFGFTAGIFTDVLGRSSQFGLGTASLVISLIILQHISRVFEKKDFRVIPILIVFATIFNELFWNLGLLILGYLKNNVELFITVFHPKIVIPKITNNLIAGFVIFLFMKYGGSIFRKKTGGT